MCKPPLLTVGVLAVIAAWPAAGQSTAELIKKLESGNYKQWQPALEELVKIGPPAAADVLAALNHKNWNVRRCAVIIVGRWKEPKAIPVLMANLKSGSGHVLYEPSIEALRQIGPPATAGLLEALTGPDQTLRYPAARVLEGIQDEQAAAGLLRAIESQDAEVRRHAARALGKRKDASAVEPLLAMTARGDAAVRLAAVPVLGEMREPRAVEPLAALLKAGPDDLRQAAAFALGAIDSDPALAALDAHRDLPAAAAVLKRVDTRGKPSRKTDSVELTLVGHERVAEYPGLSLPKCPPQSPCEFAVLYVRANCLRAGQEGLMITGALVDARGKPQGQLQVPVSSLAKPGDRQSFVLVYAVPKDAVLKTLQLLGVTFELTP